MANNSLPLRVVPYACFVVLLYLYSPHPTAALGGGHEDESGSFPVPVTPGHGTVVKKADWWNVMATEFGEISAVKVGDGGAGFYDLQFITMEPNSLFLPALLHSDMVFYVDSGSGTLSWSDLGRDDDDKLQQVQLRPGDVYRLRTGSFFYIQSNLETERRKLRIYAIFSDSKNELREGSWIGAYSSLRDLVLGFNCKVLQAALNVEAEVIEELKGVERQALIVHGVTKPENLLNVHYRVMRAFLGRVDYDTIADMNKKKQKEDKKKDKKKEEKAFNILEANHDVENCNGWSLVVSNQQLEALQDSQFGVFYVNLTKGAMMGPHWNPTTAEIAVVLRGDGMVNVVCPSSTSDTECKNSRFRVEEGDLFVVPRYHPMAQMSFDHGRFIFMGFTTTIKDNHPQYLVGKASVFQTLDKSVLATAFGVSNSTMEQVLSAQREAIILECVSCGEEEARLMEEEMEEEEAKRKEEEEKEGRKRDEEEAKRREEEEEEEEAKAKEKEEERRREEAEEAGRKREQEEEAAKQQEEAARRHQQEEEAARQQQEEAKRKQQQEQEEAARRQQQEEEEEEQEEAARRQQHEGGGGGREGEAASREEEEMGRRQQEEEAAARARGGGGGWQGRGSYEE